MTAARQQHLGPLAPKPLSGMDDLRRVSLARASACAQAEANLISALRAYLKACDETAQAARKTLAAALDDYDAAHE